MKLHEFQSKQIFRENKVNVPEGKAATTVEEAVEIAKSLKSDVFVVKSQIHAGGRGKGKIYDPNDREKLIVDGGVKLAKSVDEVKELAEKFLGNLLVTKQTGAEGKIVKNILVEEAVKIAKDPNNTERDYELYISITL